MSKKSIIKNTLAQTIARFYSSFAGFLASLLIINRLGESFYGDYSKVTAFMVLGYTTLDFGLNAHVLRLYASGKNNKKILSSLIVLRLITAVIISLALVLIINFLNITNPESYPKELKYALYIGLITIFAQAIHISSNSLFQYKMSYEKLTIAVIFGSTTNLILTFIATNVFPTLRGLILALSAGYVMTGIVSLFFIRKSIIFQVDKKLIKRIFKGSIYLAAVLLFSTIANKSDIIIQGLFQSSAQVGQYSFAYRLFDFALIFPVFFMNALYPIILKKIQNNDKTQKDILIAGKYLLLLSIFASVSIYVASPIILIFKKDMILAVKVLRILSLSLPFFYLTAPLMWNIISRGKEKSLIPVYVYATILNILLNYSFAKSYDITSAAYITILTEAFIMTWLMKLNKQK